MELILDTQWRSKWGNVANAASSMEILSGFKENVSVTSEVLRVFVTYIWEWWLRGYGATAGRLVVWVQEGPWSTMFSRRNWAQEDGTATLGQHVPLYVHLFFLYILNLGALFETFASVFLCRTSVFLFSSLYSIIFSDNLSSHQWVGSHWQLPAAAALSVVAIHVLGKKGLCDREDTRINKDKRETGRGYNEDIFFYVTL